MTLLGLQGAGAHECGGHEASESLTGPLLPVDGHAMLERTTPPTKARPDERVGLVAGLLLNCADAPIRIRRVELGTTGDGARPLGTFVLPVTSASAGRRVEIEALMEASPAEGATVPPTNDEATLALVVEVRTRRSDATLPFLISSVILDYVIDSDAYRASFGSIARIEFHRHIEF